MKPAANKRPPWLKLGIGAALLAAVIGLAVYWLAPAADWTGLVEEWVDHSGVFGVLVFALIYIVATLFLIPAVVLNIAAGALFGLAWGLGLVMVSATTAALISFLVARHLLRDRITRHYTRTGKPEAIDKALRSEGWKAVALLRLSPVVPFAVKNYLFGVSRVKMRDYVIGTFLGKLPGAIVLVALGTTGRAAWEMSGPARWGLMGGGIAATVLVSWLIGRSAKRRLGLT